MTTAEKLAVLSGLSGVSAAEHLKKIAASVGIASVLLVSASGLSSGTAEAHLQAVSTTKTVVIEPTKVGNTTSSGTKIHIAELYANKKINTDIEFKNKLIQQDEELLTIISFMVANKIIV